VRAIAEEANDLGKSDMKNCGSMTDFTIMCWGDQFGVWDQDSTEREDFLANHNLQPTPAKSRIYVLCHDFQGQLTATSLIYISLVP
jgi:hypothetical protein